MTADLHVLRPESGPLEPPPDRGRLLTPDEVARMLGAHEEMRTDKEGKEIVVLVDPSPAWVRGSHGKGKDRRPNVPNKVTLGHSTIRYYELDVRTWMASRRSAG